MKPIARLFSALLLLALLALPAASAWATTAGSAANTQIINTATLSSGGILMASSQVIVTVALIPSQPNISINSGTIGYLGPNSPAITDSVIITTTANGPASYLITPSVSNSTNTTLPTVSTAPMTITLGASITTGTSTFTLFTVPCFPYANDAANNGATQINGIGIGDTIVFTINSIEYTRLVTGVTNPGTAGGTATITFNGTPLPLAAGPGTPIYEKQTVSINVLPGTIIASGPATPIKVDVQAIASTTGVINVTVDTSTPAAGLTTPNIWTTPSLNVNVTKYVRNTLAAGNVAGTVPTNFTFNGTTNTYYRDKVTAKMGDVLEYVVHATNSGIDASYNLNSSSLSDLIPTAFATFFPSQYGAVGKDIWYIDQDGVEAPLNADGTGKASYIAANNPNLVVNVGTGAGVGTPGLLGFGKNVKIFYQVTVK